MKKIAWFLIGFFPYCFMFEGLLMLVGFIELPLTTHTFPIIIVIPVVAYVLARLGFAYLLEKEDRSKFVPCTRLLNIIQIPAHFFNVIYCIGFVMTLFGIIFAPGFIAVIALTFHLTGQVGQEAVQWALEEGILTPEEAARERDRQTVPIMSLISACTLHEKSKEVTP